MKKLMYKAVALRLNDLLVVASITDSKLLQLPKIATAKPMTKMNKLYKIEAKLI